MFVLVVFHNTYLVSIIFFCVFVSVCGNGNVVYKKKLNAATQYKIHRTEKEKKKKKCEKKHTKKQNISTQKKKK